MTRPGGSLRMQARIATEAVIGSSPRTAPAIGVTATTGSRAERMIRSPIVAFQKLITVHGSVTANNAVSATMITPDPPAESASAHSQVSAMIEMATRAKN